MTTEEIANEEGVTSRQIYNWMVEVRQKLGARGRAHAVAIFLGQDNGTSKSD